MSLLNCSIIPRTLRIYGSVISRSLRLVNLPFFSSYLIIIQASAAPLILASSSSSFSSALPSAGLIKRLRSSCGLRDSLLSAFHDAQSSSCSSLIPGSFLSHSFASFANGPFFSIISRQRSSISSRNKSLMRPHQ